MSKLQPIWQNIPFHFKKSVVENLDYVSRCHLRSCSKEEKNIVDSCSSVIDYLCLSLTEPAFGNGEDAEKPAQISIKDKKTEFSKNFKKDDVIERFLSIFLNALVSVNTMEIHVWGIHRKSQHFKFFKAFLIEIKKKNLKFKVRKLELATVFPDKNQLISLIKCLDIDHIVSINLIRTTGFQFEELSKTEQFKKLKELSVETRHEISPELLSHLDSFKVTVKRMIGEVVSEIIKVND
uniref:F-box domain-containing protein n=1 Tax=Caenorhabditis tropicalis TaxID=1561998 RepID=A0A1I7SYV4_9PELO